jgi:hypothetical protein
MFGNPTIKLGAVCNCGAKIACCPSELTFRFLYAGSSTQNAKEQFAISFMNFVLDSTLKQKSNGIKSGDLGGCISVTIQN